MLAAGQGRGTGVSTRDQMGPLAGIRVIDLTHARAGPACVRQLADWGADVIKVEPPPAIDSGSLIGPRDGSDYQNTHRNKRSLTLDLKQSDGVAVLHRLVARADVLAENFRPAVKHRLGIGYEAMAALNPRLVYASISAFGQDGPYADRPGVDQIAQGLSGLMSVTGLPGQGPVRVGIPIADLSSGHFAAQGVLLALLERHRTGRGQQVETSLLEAQVALMDFQATRWLIDGKVPPPAGNDHPTLGPMGLFETEDEPINLAAFGPLFDRFCQAAEAPELLDDPRFADEPARQRHRSEVNEAVTRVLRRRPAAEWIDRMNRAGVPCGPVLTVDRVFADPQVRHLTLAQPVEHPRLGRLDLVAQPMRLGGRQAEMARPAPDPGQHSDEILAEIGYDEAAIADLRTRAII